MVQRDTTTVISVIPSATTADASYMTAPTLEDDDLIGLSVPFSDLYTGNQALTRTMRELDKKLIEGLEAVGPSPTTAPATPAGQ